MAREGILPYVKLWHLCAFVVANSNGIVQLTTTYVYSEFDCKLHIHTFSI